MHEPKIPFSKRLSRVAELVPTGARVADIGCDHGYLAIDLIKSGRASFVHACDLREQPLQRGMENAARFGLSDKIRFSVADGLSAIGENEVDTVVCAGMGGELICQILEAAPWIRRPDLTLVLQPQSSGNELRRRLPMLGFRIEKEVLVEDSGFIYYIMLAVYAPSDQPTVGEEYCSKALLHSGDPLLPAYLRRLTTSLTATVESIRRSENPPLDRLRHYETALCEIKEMEEMICRP